jgi:hypothetical protein
LLVIRDIGLAGAMTVHQGLRQNRRQHPSRR